jgi:hypothetical protein
LSLPESFQINLRTLNGTDTQETQEAARWFARYPVHPERVVPLLVRGFADPLTSRDCASALRAYGLRAGFTVDRLVTPDRTNSWEATWVVEGIEPVTAKKTRLKR